MVIKNARLYRVTKSIVGHDELEEGRHHPPSALESSSVGWVNPCPHVDSLAYGTSTATMLSMRIDSKIVPGQVLRDAVDERVEKIEREQQRKVGRKEKAELKDLALAALLPVAFIRSTIVSGYLTSDGWLIVDTTSANKAEEFIALLRRCLGSFPAQIASVRNEPARVMTSWLEHGPSDTYTTIGTRCELTEPGEDGGKVKCANMDLSSNEVIDHITSGMLCTAVELQYGDDVKFMLREDMTIRGLKFSGDDLEENADIEDEAARFDADLILMVGYIDTITEWIGREMGGWRVFGE